MKCLSLQVLVALPWVVGCFVLCGCAAQPGAVSFAPLVEELPVAAAAEKKLENMPLETLVTKGIAYLEQGNFSLAQLHLLKALTLDPNNIEIYGYLGVLFLEMEKFDKAQTAFSAVLKNNPDNWQALLGMGKIYRLTGKNSEAEITLVQAQRVAPDAPEILTELAICYDTSGREVLAEKLYRQVTALLPGNPSPFNNLGFHYLIHGDYAQATTALLAANKMNTDDRRIKNNLAAAYLLSGNESCGLALFENSIGQAGALNNLGYIYMIQNNWQQAEAAFVQALERSPRYYVKAAKNLDYLRALLARQATDREIILETPSIQ